MALTETCRDYVGRQLLILPYYGYGWNRQDRGAPSPSPLDVLGPEPFHLQAEELFSLGGELAGASGVIIEEQHVFHGQYCVFFLREVGIVNFTDHAGHYMIWITPTKPRIQPISNKAVFEWVLFDDSSPCLCGYGMAAESVEWILDTYNKTMASRQLVRERQS